MYIDYIYRIIFFLGLGTLAISSIVIIGIRFTKIKDDSDALYHDEEFGIWCSKRQSPVDV